MRNSYCDDGEWLMAHCDRYGGCAEMVFDATGFFRLVKTDRWWFVTPEGHAFLSFGVNHVEPGLMQRPENRTHWMAAFGLGGNADRNAFLHHFQGRVQEDLQVFGFNTLGCHSSTQHYPQSFVPYVYTLRFVDICHWMSPTEEDFPDVFAPDFESLCDRKAREAASALRDDAYLLGYSFGCGYFSSMS